MEEKIIELIRKYCESNIEISAETDILSDLELSSLELMALIANIEDEFKVVIKSKQLKRMETVGDLFDVVRELKDR